MLKNYLFSPLYFFLSFLPWSARRPLLLFFSSGQRLSFASTLFFFSVLALPHFSPALTFFFSFGCPLFFSPNVFQPKCFSVFSAQTFLLQFSHSSLLLFLALFFSGSAFFFLFQCLFFFVFFSFVYPRPSILSSCFTSLLFE